MPSAITVTSSSMEDFAVRYDANKRKNRELSHQVLARNKTTLCAALNKIGITTVVVSFDGYGDEGQIVQIVAHAGNATVELPDTMIDLELALWAVPDPERASFGIPGAIERIVYDLLEVTHGGWEDNEGAFGEFTLDVAQRTITLSCSERYIASQSFEHTF